VRLRERPSGRPVDIRTENDGKENVKHFWAFAVWNYADKMVQVLEVTQKQIQNGIKDLVDDEAWGDPKQYDIAVTRNGSGFDTEYLTKGIPPKPLGDGIAEEYAKNPSTCLRSTTAATNDRDKCRRHLLENSTLAGTARVDESKSRGAVSLIGRSTGFEEL